MSCAPTSSESAGTRGARGWPCSARARHTSCIRAGARGHRGRCVGNAARRGRDAADLFRRLGDRRRGHRRLPRAGLATVTERRPTALGRAAAGGGRGLPRGGGLHRHPHRLGGGPGTGRPRRRAPAAPAGHRSRGPGWAGGAARARRHRRAAAAPLQRLVLRQARRGLRADARCGPGARRRRRRAEPDHPAAGAVPETETPPAGPEPGRRRAASPRPTRAGGTGLSPAPPQRHSASASSA